MEREVFMTKKPVHAAALGVSTSLLLILSGCGQSEDISPPVDPAEQEATQASELQGMWASNCGDSTLFGISSDRSLEVEGNRLHQVYRFYGDGSCDQVNVEIRRENIFDKQGATENGLSIIDISSETATVTPLNQTGVDILTLAQFCGVSDWEVGGSRDVTAQSGTGVCFGQEIPATHEQVYLVEENSLYFGVDDPSERATRPTELDRELVFTKR